MATKASHFFNGPSGNSVTAVKKDLTAKAVLFYAGVYLLIQVFVLELRRGRGKGRHQKKKNKKPEDRRTP